MSGVRESVNNRGYVVKGQRIERSPTSFWIGRRYSLHFDKNVYYNNNNIKDNINKETSRIIWKILQYET